MKPIDHPFFDFIDLVERRDAWNAFEGRTFPKAHFLNALKEAHPFIFDQTCTLKAIVQGCHLREAGTLLSQEQRDVLVNTVVDRASKVEGFSLPFRTVLYLFTAAPALERNKGDHALKIGVLVKEITPEKFEVFDLNLHKVEDVFLPAFDCNTIDLAQLNLNGASDVLIINSLTDMLSTKRVGIEVDGIRTVKTKGVRSGFASLKYPKIYHVAEETEYQYVRPVCNGNEIAFKASTFVRGTWRALYHGNLVDSEGHRIVDYTRTGKDRENNRNVPGYTWVIEHVRGDKDVAQVKTRYVSA